MAKCFKGSQLVLMTISLSLAIFMNVLDISIANVSIPSIAGDLGVSPNQGTWVITSFAVTSAIMLPITGWLARRVGEVRLFVFCTLMFTFASWLCGLSTNLGMIVTFRVLQGAFAGPMIPLSQSLLLAHYPDDKKALSMALWSMIAVIAPVFGPIMGGWITDNYSWPWIFYINIPVGLISAYMTWHLLKDDETATAQSPIDIAGLLLLIVGIGSLQILLDQGNDLDWFNSPLITSLGIISFICLTFLVAWELTEDNPIIDLSLFKRRNFAIGTIAIALGYTVFFGNVVIFPLWLQTQLNYTPTWAGLATAPIGIFAVILSPFVGRYMHKVDLRIIVSFSFFMFAFVSFWSSTFDTTVSFHKLIMPRLVMGVAIACFFTPLITIVLSGLPASRVASAAGLTNFFRILGGSFGTSLSVSFWEHRASFYHARLSEHITNFNPSVYSFVQQTMHLLHLSNLSSFALLNNILTNQGFMQSTIDFFWLSGMIFFSLIFLVWLSKPPFMSEGKAMVE